MSSSSNSQPSSPEEDSLKFYNELLAKYQLYRTKNSLNLDVEVNKENEWKGEPSGDLKNESQDAEKSESKSENKSETQNESKSESKNDQETGLDRRENDDQRPIGANVFIVEPDDQLLTEFFDDSDLTLKEKLVKLRDRLQEEVDKELKIKEGSESLRKVSKDQNILQHLNCILRQSNYRLNELKRDLNELNSHISIHSGQGQSPKPQKKDSFDSYSDKEEEAKSPKLLQLDTNRMRPDCISIGSIESLSSPNTRIVALEKQLDIENKVKEGALNMLEMYSKNRNKKFMKEAKTMLEYSDAKIDYIKMMIDKIREQDKRTNKKTDEKSAANLNLLQFESMIGQKPEGKAADKNNNDDQFKSRFLQTQSKSSSCIPSRDGGADVHLSEELVQLINQEKLLNLRIEELKARLKLELTVMDGLKSIILTLQADKTDKNTIQDAKNKLTESYQKVFLLRHALKSVLDRLDPKSSKHSAIDEILRCSKNASTDLKAKSAYTSLPTDFNQQIDLNALSNQSQFSLPKTSQICGKLEIKLIGVKNLLTRIERYDSDSSSRSSKASYKVNDKRTSNEIKAVLKLDNTKVGETTWQTLKSNSPDEYSNCFQCMGFFPVDLDRNRELEVQFYYNDFREFCAFKHLYLEDYVDGDQPSSHELELEPQGSLRLELKISNPMVVLKNNRLQRRKLLRFKSETFLRPNQMGVNVATWSRLMKNNVFENPKNPKFSSTKSFASFTPASRKKLDERSSSSESASSASMCQVKLDRSSTEDSFKEEDEQDLDESDDDAGPRNEKGKVTDDKLAFIKQLQQQKLKEQSNEIEIASLSSSEEEEVELIDLRVTVDEDEKPKGKGVFRSKTENLRAKPTIRKNKDDLRLDFSKQTTRIESLDDSDDEKSDAVPSDAEQSKPVDAQPNIIELDDDDSDPIDNPLISKQHDEHPLSKLSLDKYEQQKNDPFFAAKDSKKCWETPDLKLSEFSFVCTLGRGYFGKVLLSKHNATNRYYAIKALKKKDVLARYEVDSLLSEKNVFLLAKQNRHPFLIQLFACIQTPEHVCFVVEYVCGGDLMHHINQEIFDEERAVFYASSLVLCIEFLHKNKIIYRDLKLDNILLDRQGFIKLSDYGLCKEGIGWNETTNTFCGTPDQIAPELLTSNSYTNAVDWWSLGIVIYQMLTGHSPFLGDDTEEIFDSIVNDEVVFPKYLSFESTVLIRRLLRKDPTKRLGASSRDAEDVKKHSFFKEINFDDLYHKRIVPPFKPCIVYDADVSNFEYEFTSRDPTLSFSNISRKLTDKDQKLFGSFDYISDEWKRIMDGANGDQEGIEMDLVDQRDGDQRDDQRDDQPDDQLRSAWPADDCAADLDDDENSDIREVQQSRSSDKLELSDEQQDPSQPDQMQEDIEVKEYIEDAQEDTGEDDAELRQSTGGEQDSTIQKFKFNEVEEIFVDLIERSEDEQVAE